MSLLTCSICAASSRFCLASCRRSPSAAAAACARRAWAPSAPCSCTCLSADSADRVLLSHAGKCPCLERQQSVCTLALHQLTCSVCVRRIINLNTGLSQGGKAGVTLAGIFAFVVIIVVPVMYFKRRRRLAQEAREAEQRTNLMHHA